MRKKTTTLALFFLVCVTAVLSAQTLVRPTDISNTFMGSGYIFRTDADYFMSVVDYTSINKDLLFLGFTSGMLQGGASMYLTPSIYFGGYYIGNAVNRNINPDTTQVASTYLLDNYNIVGETVTTTATGTSTTGTNNTAYFLVGLYNIGIKLGFVENTSQTFDRWAANGLANSVWGNINSPSWFSLTGGLASRQSDSTTVTYGADLTTTAGKSSTTYTGGVSTGSSLQPVLNVGTKLVLGSMILRPQATASVNFFPSGLSQTYANYLQDIASGYPTYSGVTEVKSYNTVNYSYVAGATILDLNGDVALDLKTGNKGASTFELVYDFNSPLYNNSYTDNSGASQNVAGMAYSIHALNYTYNASAPWTSGLGTDTRELRAYEAMPYSQQTHTITPSYTFLTSLSDKLLVGIKVGAQVAFYSYSQSDNGNLTSTETFTSSTDAALSTTDTITKTHTGGSTDYSKISFSPELDLGLQFTMVPNTLVLNVGGTVYLPNGYSWTNNATVPGIDTQTEVVTDGTGQVLYQTYSSTLGSARTETQTSNTNMASITTAVHADLAFALAQGVVLDMALAATNSTTIAPNFKLQLSLSW